MSAVDAARAVVVDAGRTQIGLYPVRAGRVLETAAVLVPPSGLESAVRGPRLARAGGARRLALARGLAAQPEGARLLRASRAGTTARARGGGARGAARALRRPRAGW